MHTRHTKQLIRTCQLSSWALCITTSWVPTMYEFFCFWASTCAFQHFEHSKFSFPSYNLAHFGVPYLCSLNLGKSSNQDLQKEMIKQQGQFCYVKPWFWSHDYVTMVALLNVIVYILQMARSNVLNCTYSGTKLLNSYPPLNCTLCRMKTLYYHTQSVKRTTLKCESKTGLQKLESNQFSHHDALQKHVARSLIQRKKKWTPRAYKTCSS